MATRAPLDATTASTASSGLPDLSHELIEAGASGRLVVLVGSGASYGSGLPMWKGLLDELFQQARVTEGLLPNQQRELAEVTKWFEDGSDLLEKASFLRDTMGEEWLRGAITAVLRASPSHPTEMHRALAELPDASFVTTNYDALLEKALAEQKGKPPKVVLPPDLEGIRDFAPGQVLKLHGDLDRPETLVLSIEDYFRVGHLVRPAWKERLKAWLQPPYQILLVGYSFSDVDLQEVVNQLQGAYEGRLSGPFWLERGGARERAKAKAYGLRPVWWSAPADVVSWLRKLARAIDDEKARAPAMTKAVAYAGQVYKELRARNEEAGRLFGAQRYSDAQAIYEQILRDAKGLAVKAPDDKELGRWIAGSHVNIGCCLLNMQQMPEARAIFRRVAEEEVEHLPPGGRAILSSAFAQVGDLETAKAVLPGHSDGLGDREREALREARQLIDVLEGREPEGERSGSLILGYHLGRLRLKQGRLAEAAREAIRSMDDAPENAVAALLNLITLEAALRGTVFEYEDAIERIPEAERAGIVQRIEMGLSRLEGAAALPQGRRLDAARLRYQFYDLTEDDERTEQAARDLPDEEASEDLPGPEQAALKAGQKVDELARQGRVDEALAILPSTAHPWQTAFERVQLMRLGRREQALSEVVSLAQKWPGRAPIEYVASALHLQAAQPEEALVHAQRAFQALPGRGYRRLLGQCMLNCGRPKEAWDMLAPLAGSRDPRVLAARASAAEHVAPQEAVALWGDYLRERPNDLTVRLGLAYLKHSLGDFHGAAEDAWDLASTSGDELDASHLYGCAQIQRLGASFSEDERKEARRRVLEIAARLEQRFPDDPEAEHHRFQLLARLGFPAEAKPIEYDRLVKADHLRKGSLDDLKELLHRERAYQQAAHTFDQWYKSGRLSFEALCELTESYAADLVVRFDRAATEGEQPTFSTPIAVGQRRPLPNLEGVKILTGELELLLLQRLGLLGRFRNMLKEGGKLLLFQDVWERIRETTLALEHRAQRAALEKAEDLLAFLKNALPKIHMVEDVPRASDSAWAAAQGLPIVDHEPAPSGSQTLSPRALVLQLQGRGYLDRARAERLLRYLPGEPEPLPALPEPLPSRFAIAYVPLVQLWHEGALKALLNVVKEALVIGPDTSRQLRKDCNDPRVDIEAANLAAAVHRVVGAGIKDGWIQADVERPPMSDLPHERREDGSEPERAPFRDVTARALSFRQALVDDPERWLLTADFCATSPPDVELLKGLAWKSGDQYVDLTSRLSSVNHRVLHLSELVRRLLHGPEARTMLFRLNELGFTDALRPDDLLHLYEQYRGLDKPVPQRILNRLEWAARKTAPEHAGASLASLQIATMYAGAIADAFTKEEWIGRDADKRAITVSLLGRVEAIDNAKPATLLDLVIRFTIGRFASKPKHAFEPITTDKRVVSPSVVSPVGRFWTDLLSWAGPEGRRRASCGRALRESWLLVDTMTWPSGPTAVQAAPLLMSISVGPNNFMHPEIEAPAILSANWVERPLSTIKGTGAKHSLEGTLRRIADVVNDGSRRLAVNEAVMEVSLPDGDTSRPEPVPPEAVLLRAAPEQSRDLAEHLSRAQGPHDGRAYELLQRLTEAPEDRELRREFARMTVTAPWKLVREDPSLLQAWGRRSQWGDKAFPSGIDDLRKMLSEPDEYLSADASFFDVLGARMRGEGVWEARLDKLELCTQASEVPGILPSFLLLTRLVEEETRYDEEVWFALRRLEAYEDQPAARLAGDIFFLRVAAARKPYVHLPEGEVDLRERLPERFLAVLKAAVAQSSPSSLENAATLAQCEAGILRLCTRVVTDLAWPGMVPLRDGLWLTYRLYQWLCAQLEALPRTGFLAALDTLQQISPPPEPLPPGVVELLHPLWFSPSRFNHRLATLLYAFAFMEDLPLQVPGVPGEINEPPRSVTSAALEGLLAEIAARPLSPEECLIRSRGEKPSEMDWHGPGTIPDLALYALLRLNGEALFHMTPERRMRWLEDLPRTPEDRDRVSWSLASVIIAAATTYAQKLSAEEKIAFHARLKAMDGPKAPTWRWLGYTQLFGAGMVDLEPEVQRLLFENLTNRAAPEALGSYLTGISFVAPERLKPEAERMFTAIEAAGDDVDPIAFAPALGRVIVSGNPENIPVARGVLQKLAERPPYKEHERIRRLLSTLGIR